MRTKAHEAEVTHMRGGGYRAECACGWWTDHPSETLALDAVFFHGAKDDPCDKCRQWIVQNDPFDYVSAHAYEQASRRAHRMHA